MRKTTFLLPAGLHRRLKVAAAEYESEMGLMIQAALLVYLDRVERIPLECRGIESAKLRELRP